MKKIFFILCLSAVVISCNRNEDNSVVDNTPILPTKIILDGQVANISYDGTKISKISSIDGTISWVFTYTGNLITNIKALEGSTIIDTYDYVYSNDKLIARTNTNYKNGVVFSIEKFTYNQISSTNIKVNRNYILKDNSYNETTSGDYTLLNGKVTNINLSGSQNNGGSSYTSSQIANFSYSDKNAPFKNVTGFDNLILDDEADFIFLNSKNPCTSYSSVSSHTGVNSSGVGYTIYKSVYTYNMNNFPTKEVRDFYDDKGVLQSGDTEIYYYEYNK